MINSGLYISPIFPGLSFKVIGPANSGGLYAMKDELTDAGSAGMPDYRRLIIPINVYSPWATAFSVSEMCSFRNNSDCRVIAATQAPSENVSGENTTTASSGIAAVGEYRFHQVGEVNKGIAASLMRELDHRYAGDPRRMALIGQWDTEYARNLQAAICDAAPFPHVRKEFADRSEKYDAFPEDLCVTKGIIRYNFLRGVDGKIVGDLTKDHKPPQTAKSLEVDHKAGDSTSRAEGASQLDYARRIVGALLAKERELRRKSLWEWVIGSNDLAWTIRQTSAVELWSRVSFLELWNNLKSKGIRAIGIIGNDYYDKLSLISLLKPAFPEAVFFTTDLDANMLNPEDNRWMRNLIVASSYGLELKPGLQEDTPPFRDGLQTAAFLSVRLALDATTGNTTDAHGNCFSDKEVKLYQAKRQQAEAHSKIFEIGRTQAVDYSSSEGNASAVGIPLCRDGNNGESSLVARSLADKEMPKKTEESENLSSANTSASLQSPVSSMAAIAMLGALAWWLPASRKFVAAQFAPLAAPLAVSGAVTIVLSQSGCWLAVWLMLWLIFWLWIGWEFWKDKSNWKAAVLSAIAALLFLGGYLYSGLLHEPFYWLEGVTLWPSEMLKLLSIGLSLWFVHCICSTIARSDRQISEHFFGHPPTAQCVRQLFWGILKSFFNGQLKQRAEAPADKAADLYDSARSNQAIPQNQRKATLITSAWNDYQEVPVLWLSLVATVLFFSFCVFFITAFGFPIPPARGGVEFFSDLVLTCVSVFLGLWLLFYVGYATSRITLLAARLWGNTKWPRKVLDKHHLKFGHAMENWLDVQLIARCTEDFKSLLFYPIVIMVLIAFAHSRIFDGWSLPRPVLFLYGVCALILLSYPLRLRLTAEKTREHSIEYLKRALANVRNFPPGYSGKADLIAQLEAIIEDASSLNRGAFAPFFRQDYVQAIMALLGSASIYQLLDYFQFG